MKTLKELFDEHGSVWLAHKDTPNQKELYIHCYSKADPNLIIIEGRKGAVFRTPDDNDCYVLYREPKKKVVRYLYAIWNLNSGLPYLYHSFYKDDEEFIKENPYIKDIFRKGFKRLDYTATEFEE